MKGSFDSQRVVYTAVIGDYERFSAVRCEVRPGTRLVVFSDGEIDLPGDWEVIRIEPRFPMDAVRSARFIKIMGHVLLPGCHESLWIDNSVSLKVSPDLILDQFLADADMAMPWHSFRETLAAEFDAVVQSGFDDFTKVYEQLIHYAAISPSLLGSRPLWTGLMARRHTEKVSAAMHVWWEQVLRYSRRDQLSVNLALNGTGVKLKVIDIDNVESSLHSWKTAGLRKKGSRKASSLLAAFRNVPASRMAQLENQNRQLRDVIRKKKQTPPPDFFRRVVAALFRGKSPNLVQIGVCDGVINDPVHPIALEGQEKIRLLLVEPQLALLPYIRDNYAFHNDCTIVNCAVGPPGNLLMYRLKEQLVSVFEPGYLRDAPSYRVPAGFVSADRDHVVRHAGLGLPDHIDPNDAVESFEVPCKRLGTILEESGWAGYDVLVVDAEGRDDMVLYHSDVDTFKPSLILFEHLHLTVWAMGKLRKWLEQLGYHLYPCSNSDTIASLTRLHP